MSRKRKSGNMVDWQPDSEIDSRVKSLVARLEMDWIPKSQVKCMRSYGSKARAYARIWGLTRVWQLALSEKPHYVIEVLSEKFDNLSYDKQDEVLLHELAHIPKNFSGSLLPHTRARGKRNFHDRVHELVKKYKRVG